MTSLFAEMEEIVSSSVDDVYGEATRLVREVRGQIFAASADGNKPGKTLIGVIDRNPLTAKAQDQGSYDGFQPKVGADRFHVSYNKRLFASSDEWPRQNDIIQAIDNADIPDLRVVKPPEDDGIGRIVCICEKAS